MDKGETRIMVSFFGTVWILYEDIDWVLFLLISNHIISISQTSNQVSWLISHLTFLPQREPFSCWQFLNLIVSRFDLVDNSDVDRRNTYHLWETFGVTISDAAVELINRKLQSDSSFHLSDWTVVVLVMIVVDEEIHQFVDRRRVHRLSYRAISQNESLFLGSRW